MNGTDGNSHVILSESNILLMPDTSDYSNEFMNFKLYENVKSRPVSTTVHIY